MSEAIADRLEQMILSREIRVGERLPSEHSMAEQFEVSRNILREALRTLSGRGLISVRNGDGVYVTRPRDSEFGQMMSRYARLGGVSTEQIYEMRLALEVAACGLAAQKRTSSQLKEMEAIVARMRTIRDDVKRWADEELKFHSLVAEMSHNPLLISSIHSLAEALSALFVEGYRKPHAPAEGLRGHARICRAIAAGDRGGAEKAMKLHLERSRRLVLSSVSAREKPVPKASCP